ncbi:MAG: methyltransferase domain-containing protein [Intrasporangium sp.]|uniref:class I SAM-dependent methyltransferase n=1 Tax=Intrasporangium sp. TaxID=1925024 RepID=UPI0026474FB6|nr:class I SAM-dependent methyltransferase [Intrasporangium sp.]MDN5794438.1 methyltransferase domain-containing protein [Intrasporangium sp.]
MTQQIAADQLTTSADEDGVRALRAPLVDFNRIPMGIQGDALAVHSAHEVYELLVGLWAPAIIEAAHDLGVFAELRLGAAAATGVSSALGTDTQATRVLLDALHVYGLLDRTGSERTGHTYALPSHLAEVSTNEGAFSLVGKFLHDRHVAWPAWRGLAETVRHGAHRADGGWSENQISSHDYLALAKGISFWAPPVVELLSHELQVLGWDVDGPRRMLDVGCGTGIYTHLLLGRFPTWRGLGFDVEDVVGLASTTAHEYGVADRFSPMNGDFWSTPWPAEQDLVFFGNIFHLEPRGRAQQLARLASDALADDGLVVIVDQIRVGDTERESAQDRFAVLFAASMLATGGGDTYRLAEYDRWLRDAGLARVSLVDAPMHRILIARHSR